VVAMVALVAVAVVAVAVAAAVEVLVLGRDRQQYIPWSLSTPSGVLFRSQSSTSICGRQRCHQHTPAPWQHCNSLARRSVWPQTLGVA
jgi:hypothetical protein